MRTLQLTLVQIKITLIIIYSLACLLITCWEHFWVLLQERRHQLLCKYIPRCRSSWCHFFCNLNSNILNLLSRYYSSSACKLSIRYVCMCTYIYNYSVISSSCSSFVSLLSLKVPAFSFGYLRIFSFLFFFLLIKTYLISHFPTTPTLIC